MIGKVYFLPVSKLKNAEKTAIMLEILECPEKLFYSLEHRYKLNRDMLNKMCWSDFFFKFQDRVLINLEWSSTSKLKCWVG